PDGTPEETSYRERYQATCGVGKLPQWTFFGFDSTVPSDGSIEFFVRTAKNEAELPSAPWVPVGTATNARQECPVAPSPDAECPIDLYQILGPDAAQTWMLEVEFAITPSTDHLTPQV